MPRRRKRSVAAVCGLTVATLAACGDTVTANHDWYSTSAYFSENRVVKGVGENVLLFDGPLLTAPNGTAAPNTLFRMECVRVDGGTPQPYKCLLVLNAGQKVYIAAGETPNPGADGQPDRYATLTSPARAIIVTVLGATGRSVHLKLSARTS